MRNNLKLIGERSIQTIMNAIFNGEIEYGNYTDITIKVSESNRLYLNSIECSEFMDIDLVLVEISFNFADVLLHKLMDDSTESLTIVNNYIPVIFQKDNENVINVVTLSDFITTTMLTPKGFDINNIKFDLYVNNYVKSTDVFDKLQVIENEYIDTDKIIDAVIERDDVNVKEMLNDI